MPPLYINNNTALYIIHGNPWMECCVWLTGSIKAISAALSVCAYVRSHVLMTKVSLSDVSTNCIDRQILFMLAAHNLFLAEAGFQFSRARSSRNMLMIQISSGMSRFYALILLTSFKLSLFHVWLTQWY